jgi:hypothetical protein
VLRRILKCKSNLQNIPLGLLPMPRSHPNSNSIYNNKEPWCRICEMPMFKFIDQEGKKWHIRMKTDHIRKR